eukprot:6195140-Amphidinium_carterae.1
MPIMWQRFQQGSLPTQRRQEARRETCSKASESTLTRRLVQLFNNKKAYIKTKATSNGNDCITVELEMDSSF